MTSIDSKPISLRKAIAVVTAIIVTGSIIWYGWSIYQHYAWSDEMFDKGCTPLTYDFMGIPTHFSCPDKKQMKDMQDRGCTPSSFDSRGMPAGWLCPETKQI